MYDGIKVAFGPSAAQTVPLKSPAEDIITDRGKLMEKLAEYYQELHYRENFVTDAAVERSNLLPVMNKLNVPPSADEVLKVIAAYEIIHIRTAEMKSNEEWSSQFWTQFMQLRKRPSEKKNQDFNGVWTHDLAIPVRCSNQLSYEATDVGSWSIMCSYVPLEKSALYLSVNVFSTKVLVGDTIFTSLTGDGTAILRGQPSYARV